MTEFDANNSFNETGENHSEHNVDDLFENYFRQTDEESDDKVFFGNDDNASNDIFSEFFDNGNSEQISVEEDSKADITNEEDNVESTTTEIATSEPADDFRIKIGDEELTYGELKNGYFRQSDYTRKTQELAASKANLEQSQNAANQLIQKYVIDHMRRAYQVELMGEPDWKSLKENDPFGYAEKREAWDIKMAKFAELELLERNMQQKRVDYEAKQFAAMQTKARDEFFHSHPEFKDKTVGKAHINGMVKYLSDLGFSNEEIEGVADSRMLKIVYAAYKAQYASKQIENARETVASKPKINAPKSTGTKTAYDKHRERLQKTGSIDDAVKALSALF